MVFFAAWKNALSRERVMPYLKMLETLRNCLKF